MIPKSWQWLLVAVVCTAMLAIATFSGNDSLSDGERVQYLSERFACPVCDGQSVSESNAAVATTIREFIAVEVNAGSTDTEIRDTLRELEAGDDAATLLRDALKALGARRA